SHLVAIEIHHVCSLEDQQTTLLYLNPGPSNVLLDGTLSSQGFAKRYTVHIKPKTHPVNHELQGPLCITNEPHTVVYPARTKSSLGNLEPSPFA
ncbi:hypothetical protein EGW08_018792, partial [Elysia chlorotica]